MNKTTTLLTVAALITTLPAIAAPAAGTIYEQAQLELEIRSCVAEVGDHADYDGASRVRHEVTVSDRRGVGHKLDIRTSIYAAGDDQLIRAYATRCVVYRDNPPVRFEISTTESGT